MSAEPLMEAALVELLDAAPDGIVLVAADGRIAFANEALEQLFGYDRGALAGEAIETLVPARYAARHVTDRDTYAAGPVRRPMGLGMQLLGLRRDGSEFPVEISLAPLTTAGRTMTVSIVRDATEQRVIQEERVRHERSQAVEEIVSGLEAIVWQGTAPDRESMTYLGGREEAFLGYPPDQWLQPGFWLSVVHPDDQIAALAFAEAARKQDTFELEYRLIDAGGGIHDVRDIVSVKRDEDGELNRLSGVIVDITERRELEVRLSQAQKMEAVGQLAGGIAHDFNNLLTIVSGYARRLRARAEMDNVHGDLDQIIAATDRAADLTRQLLAFARRGQGERELLDANDAIRSLEPMLRRVIDADIVFRFDLAERLPRVMMDRTGLEQVLMNLIINAADAMGGAGGALTVTTRTQPASDAEVGLHSVAGGDGVQIMIADTGPGITPEVRERIFEPFFTTKADKGTGMGLATVYGIVEQAGGWIDVDTVVGVGTTFQIMLPAAPMAPARGAQPAERPTERATLLLVEDESSLRAIVVSMLEEQGFEVLQAADGLDAIALAEHHHGPIDLLLTDVVMPRLSGPELALRVRGLRPGLEVLFMSGYNDSRLVSRAVEQASVNLLLKPFTPTELIDRVRALTERATVAGVPQ
jgi:PAS domain S-box-containing protein